MIPKNFIPKKSCKPNLKKLEKTKRVERIEDLVLEPRELEKNYEDWETGRLTKEEFENNYFNIKWHDLKDNFYIVYDVDKLDAPVVEVLEYATKDLLQESFYKICSDMMSKNREEDIRVLIFDKYAIFLYGDKRKDKAALKNLEEVYKNKFGTKRLTRMIEVKFDLE